MALSIYIYIVFTYHTFPTDVGIGPPLKGGGPDCSPIRHCGSRGYVFAQATKHASTQCVCKSHPDFQCEQLVHNFSTYTRINTVFTYEPHETGPITAGGSRSAGWQELPRAAMSRDDGTVVHDRGTAPPALWKGGAVGAQVPVPLYNSIIGNSRDAGERWDDVGIAPCPF